MTPIRWQKSYIQATRDMYYFMLAFQFPSCKSIFLSLRHDEIGMLNCEKPRWWRKGTYWEVRKLHLGTPRSLWELYQINSISKMLLVNEHKRKCLSDEQRKVEVVESITLSLGKQFDIQEFRWNFVPLGVSCGHRESVELRFLSPL